MHNKLFIHRDNNKIIKHPSIFQVGNVIINFIFTIMAEKSCSSAIGYNNGKRNQAIFQMQASMEDILKS